MKISPKPVKERCLHSVQIKSFCLRELQFDTETTHIYLLWQNLYFGLIIRVTVAVSSCIKLVRYLKT